MSPILEFKCPLGHKTERLYLTFKEAEHIIGLECPVCKTEEDKHRVFFAERVEFSVPFPAHFHGTPDGYHRPSPQKRHSTKLINRETGNRGTQRKG